MSEPIEQTEVGPIHEYDTFRKLEAVGTADPRSAAWEVLQAMMTIEDRWKDIYAVKLNDGVPRSIRIHFDTARNLLFYAWFVYRFQQVAEMHAYASAEYALRVRAGIPPMSLGPGLKKLLKQAVDEGWIRDGGFRHYHQLVENRALRRRIGLRIPEPATETPRYVEIIRETIPYFRNRLAHGNSGLSPHEWPPSGLRTLALCCDLINQLYPATDGAA